MDHSYLFQTDWLFNLKVDLIKRVKKKKGKDSEYIRHHYAIFVKKGLSHRSYVYLSSDRGMDDKEEEQVHVIWRGPYGAKKYNHLFHLKGEEDISVHIENYT